MTRLLLLWACNIAALFVADALVDGIHVETKWYLILAGLVLGIVNAVVKPIVTILSLPVIILTLGIALFFVNLLMLYITSWVVPGFEIDGFGSAVAGTLVVWLVNWVLQSAFGLDDRKKRGKDRRRR